MLRNINSRFSEAPVELDLPRSRFDRSSDHKTTFNAGDLVPIFLDEVLPGDTFDCKTAYTCRMSTPIFPVMDNAYLETFFFFVPARLVWDHWKEFNGENNTTYWTQPVEYNVPQIRFPEGSGDFGDETGLGGFRSGSLADYFGLPINVGNRIFGTDGVTSTQSVSALPFRAYVKIWNDWFRDQNTMQPAYMPTDDSDRDGVGDPVTDPRTTAHLGGALLKVSKYHDYFTSALPETQKGDPVAVAADGGFSGAFNVVTTDRDHFISGAYGMHLYPASGTNLNTGESFPAYLTGIDPFDVANDPVVTVLDYEGGTETSISSNPEGFYPTNLVADVSQSRLQVSMLVNDIRLAFQLQKLLERDARSGTRYIEVLKAHFGVDSPDGRLQRSEYLGGTRQAININQVLQTSATDERSPLGSTAAYSLTNAVDNSFIKSFTEHGFIIGLACVRTDHTYQQGINRMWSRKRRFDFYWPSLAHIGEQAILKKELLATCNPTVDEEAFGYQEAWAEYRYKPSIVTGAFRSNINDSLDSWHYADFFDPDQQRELVISEEFLQETPVNVDRTLAVQSSLEDQFIADFYFKNTVTRVMPLYSVPGLVDHY